jgi:osmotically-inducible protein OsmY
MATTPVLSGEAFEAAARWAMHDGYAIRPDRVCATLRDGCASLTGSVQWQYQKDGATRCVRTMAGVNAVNNQLRLVPDGDSSTWAR